MPSRRLVQRSLLSLHDNRKFQVSGFSVEDLVIDVFFWFDKSTKRKAALAEYCSFCDADYRQIVKHVSTRWLSLEKAVSRLLQQHAALKSYFASEGELFAYSDKFLYNSPLRCQPRSLFASKNRLQKTDDGDLFNVLSGSPSKLHVIQPSAPKGRSLAAFHLQANYQFPYKNGWKISHRCFN